MTIAVIKQCAKTNCIDEIFELLFHVHLEPWTAVLILQLCNYTKAAYSYCCSSVHIRLRNQTTGCAMGRPVT